MNIGKLAAAITANAGPMLAAFKTAQAGAKSYTALAARETMAVARQAETAAAETAAVLAGPWKQTARAAVHATSATVQAALAAAPRIATAWLSLGGKAAGAFSGFGKMAGSSIVRSISAVLRTQMGQAIAAAGGAIAAAGSRLMAPVAGIARTIGPAVSATLGAVGQTAGHLAGVLGTALKGALGVVGTAAWEFGSAFLAGIDELIRTDNAARRLGLTVLDLRGAMLWAGPAAASMVPALQSIQETLAGARIGSIEATRSLTALAAVSGRTARQLASGGWPEVIDALAAIPDPAVRAAYGYRLLGNAAGDLLAQLERGGAQKAKDLAARLGLGANAGDLAAIRAVAKAIQDIQAVGQGVFNQLLLGIAPFAAKLAEMLSPSSIDLTWIKDAVGGVVKGVLMIGAFFVEGVKNSQLFFDALDVGFLRIKASVMGLAAEMAKLTSRSVLGNTNVMFIDDAFTGASPITADSAGAEFAMSAERARRAAEKKQRSLGRRVADSASGRGVTGFVDDALKTYKTIGQALDGMGRPVDAITAKYTEMFRTMSEAARTPAEAFRQTVADIAQMQNLKLFAGNPQMASRFAFKAATDLIGGAGMSSGPQFAGAAEANTREAYSSIASFRAEAQRGGVQDRMLAALEFLKVKQDREVEIGGQVLQVLKKMASEKPIKV